MSEATSIESIKSDIGERPGVETVTAQRNAIWLPPLFLLRDRRRWTELLTRFGIHLVSLLGDEHELCSGKSPRHADVEKSIPWESGPIAVPRPPRENDPKTRPEGAPMAAIGPKDQALLTLMSR